LAIAFRLGHTEIAIDFLVDAPAFFFTDNDHGAAIEPGDTPDNGLVITEMAVTVKLVKIFKNPVDIVHGVGSLGMASHFDDIPGAEVGIDGFGQASGFVLKLGDLIGDIEVIVVANQLQFFDLSFKFGNGLLKVEIVQVHSFRKSCLKQRGGKGCRLLYATYPPTHSPEDSREGNWLSQS